MLWSEHVNYLSTKVARSKGIINKFRYALPVRVKLLLCYSLVYSHFYYCILIRGTTTETNVMKLAILQKRAISAIENLSLRESTRS